MYLEIFLGYISNKLKELVSDVYKDIQYIYCQGSLVVFADFHKV